ncbi:hypothetical protein NKT77_06385 [Moraxella sp. FZLJ2107]|uniref:hypothetical protein n=1 Tax=unclassified Moraxella TaxID=2685852 RepID=UPI0020C851A3|nr:MULTISPECIES: hypothetical protein [unclassified Moraxella]UTO04163.1 hypothetical protein NKT77_06385 [Moraxella sp. FZLJ2107]UTO22996.1 hypothetical protein NKU06_03170 [Moraxella sp. FZLJ2109]
MYIDDSKLNSYSREELEKVKMAINITKVLHDVEMVRKQLEMDKQRYENERMERQAQLDAEAEELKVRVAKMQAEIDEAIKATKHRPSTSVIVASIACFGSIVIALIAAVTFWLTNPV